MRSENIKKTQGIVVRALFCAIAYLLMFVLRISGIGGFLTFDAKDAVIVVAAMIFGPLTGIGISLTVALLEMLTVSGTGFWGFLMNFVSSAVFSSVASLIYNKMPKIKKKITGACAGLGLGVVLTVCVMVVMNLIITPIYTKMPTSAIAAMILPLLLPFNLIKTVLNASLVMLIYKPVSSALKRSGLIRADEGASGIKLNGVTLAVLIVSLTVAAVCAVLLVYALGGKFNLIK